MQTTPQPLHELDPRGAAVIPWDIIATVPIGNLIVGTAFTLVISPITTQTSTIQVGQSYAKLCPLGYFGVLELFAPFVTAKSATNNIGGVAVGGPDLPDGMVLSSDLLVSDAPAEPYVGAGWVVGNPFVARAYPIRRCIEGQWFGARATLLTAPTTIGNYLNVGVRIRGKFIRKDHA